MNDERKYKPGKFMPFRDRADMRNNGKPGSWRNNNPHRNQGRDMGRPNNPRDRQPQGRGGAPSGKGWDKREDGPGDRALPLPGDVRKELSWSNCRNFSLLFQRFIPSLGEDKEKNKIWQRLQEKGNQLVKTADVQGFLERQKMFAGWLKTHYGEDGVTEFIGKTRSRLSVGFGNSGPLETGITLNRIYGLPFIPGTALKGICRAYKVGKVAESLGIPRLSPEEILKLSGKKKKTPRQLLEEILFSPEPDKDEKAGEELTRLWAEIKKSREKVDAPLEFKGQDWSGERVRKEYGSLARVFGEQDSQGAVCFHDAYPSFTKEGTPNFEKVFSADIINVHYQEYYQNEGGSPAADYLSPNPIFFLAVSQGIAFRFLLSSQDQRLLHEATDWLKSALEELGVGAKTAVGYGEISVSP